MFFSLRPFISARFVVTALIVTSLGSWFTLRTSSHGETAAPSSDRDASAPRAAYSHPKPIEATWARLVEPADVDGDGDPDSTDCAPDNPGIHHAAVELPNGVDDNCDGYIDEGLSTACAPPGSIAPSPAGKLAFISNRDQVPNVADTQIYLMNPDGTQVVRLCISMHVNSPARWSRDGQKLLFVSRVEGQEQRVTIMNADGTGLMVLGEGTSPDWSPDDTQIVFVGPRSLPGTGGIFVMDSDGTDIRRLTTEIGFTDNEPRWRPDGTRIAFERTYVDTNSDIHLMNPDGADVVNVSNSSLDDRNPAWSHDSTRLAFVYGQEIWVMNADGLGKSRVHDDSVNPTRVEWSPNDTQLVFEMIETASFPRQNEIWTMYVDGTALVKITSHPSNDDSATWSPNAPWSFVGAPDVDADDDGVPDTTDNCPFISNTNQANADGDLQGDACDACPNDAANDADGDGICGNLDNCPTTPNPDQVDADGDGRGNACDACPGDPLNDADADGVCGDVDNCPTVLNPGQQDNDGDALGDACDPDDDNDGVSDGVDNCQFVANPDQRDTDEDGEGDACDPPGPPTDTDQCRNGGWQFFVTPRTFTNQGDCIRYVNKGR